MLERKLSRIKASQIVLAAITAGGGVTATFNIEERGDWGAALAALLGTALLVLNAYTKENDLGQLAQKHRQTAADLWLVREKYQSLLTSLLMKIRAVQEIQAEGEAVLAELHGIYKAAPSTNSKAYKAAQKALQINQDMTFVDGEIDKMLPPDLRRSRSRPAADEAPAQPGAS